MIIALVIAIVIALILGLGLMEAIRNGSELEVNLRYQKDQVKFWTENSDWWKEEAEKMKDAANIEASAVQILEGKLTAINEARQTAAIDFAKILLGNMEFVPTDELASSIGSKGAIMAKGLFDSLADDDAVDQNVIAEFQEVLKERDELQVKADQWRTECMLSLIHI